MCGVAAAGLALTAASAAMAAKQSYDQGKFQSGMIKRQQEVDNINTALQRNSLDEKRKRLLATQRAQYSAQGIDFSVGSARDVMADTASEFEKENYGLQLQNDLNKGTSIASAENASRNGKTGMLDNLFSVGGSLVQYGSI